MLQVMLHGIAGANLRKADFLGVCCRYPQQETAVQGLETILSNKKIIVGGRGETVDAADLKSAPRKGVWVRVPSSAPAWIATRAVIPSE
jgi:hypothetical protein